MSGSGAHPAMSTVEVQRRRSSSAPSPRQALAGAAASLSPLACTGISSGRDGEKVRISTDPLRAISQSTQASLLLSRTWWRVKRSVDGDLGSHGKKGHGLSVGSEVPGLFS